MNFSTKCTGTKEWTDKNFSLGNRSVIQIWNSAGDIHQHTTNESCTTSTRNYERVVDVYVVLATTKWQNWYDHRTPLETRPTCYARRFTSSGRDLANFPPDIPHLGPFCDSEFSAFSHGTSIIRHNNQNMPSIIRSIKNRHNPRFEKHPADDLNHRWPWWSATACV